MSAQGIQIEEKKIEAVKIWLKPKLVEDIQVLIRFANFYQCFIQGFNKIVVLLTLILKILANRSNMIIDVLDNGTASDVNTKLNKK